MTVTNEQVLNCPMHFGGTGAETIYDFFILCAIALWDEGECFSGKRPLGNSDWYTDIILSMAKEGLIKLWGSVDDYWVSDADEDLAVKAVEAAFQSLLTK